MLSLTIKREGDLDRLSQLASGITKEHYHPWLDVIRTQVKVSRDFQLNLSFDTSPSGPFRLPEKIISINETTDLEPSLRELRDQYHPIIKDWILPNTLRKKVDNASRTEMEGYLESWVQEMKL